MAISESFRTFVIDQLGRVTSRVRVKSMFGGAGVYSGDHFFALIDDDVLYLKVDDTNRPDFIAKGMKPFAPFGEGGEVMQYYRLPEELLDETDELKSWVEKAIDVALRKKARKKKKPRQRTEPKKASKASKKATKKTTKKATKKATKKTTRKRKP